MKHKGGTATHTSFSKGSKIRIIFRDGSMVIAKFVDKLSKKLMRIQHLNGVFENINTIDLRSCNYYKPLPHERQ